MTQAGAFKLACGMTLGNQTTNKLLLIVAQLSMVMK